MPPFFNNGAGGGEVLSGSSRVYRILGTDRRQFEVPQQVGGFSDQLVRRLESFANFQLFDGPLAIASKWE